MHRAKTNKIRISAATALIGLVAMLTGAVLGHNANAYQSVGGVYGVTFGTVVGCEFEAMKAPACWTGYRN